MDDRTFKEIVVTLQAALTRVDGAVRRVPAERWDEVIHTGDGPWTRRELLAHMVSNDLRQLVRIRIGAGIAEPGDDAAHAAELDTHAWNRGRVAERSTRSVAELLREMRANRRLLLALLRSLTPAQRDRPMPFRGAPTPLAEMVPVLIGHLDQHTRELGDWPG
jgi:hypothetical protein